MPLSHKSLTVVASATLGACLLAGGIATIASTLPAEEGATVLPVDGVTGTPRDSIADDTKGPALGADGLSSPVTGEATEAPTAQAPAEESPATQTPEAAAPESASGTGTVEVPPAAPVAAAPAPVPAADGHQFDGTAFVASMRNYAVRLGKVERPEWLRVASVDRSGVDRKDGALTDKKPGLSGSHTPSPAPSPAPTAPPAPAGDTATQHDKSAHHTTKQQPAQQQQPAQETKPSKTWGGSDRGWQKQPAQQHGSNHGHRDSGGGWGGQQRGGGRG